MLFERMQDAISQKNNFQEEGEKRNTITSQKVSITTELALNLMGHLQRFNNKSVLILDRSWSKGTNNIRFEQNLRN